MTTIESPEALQFVEPNKSKEIESIEFETQKIDWISIIIQFIVIVILYRIGIWLFL